MNENTDQPTGPVGRHKPILFEPGGVERTAAEFGLAEGLRMQAEALNTQAYALLLDKHPCDHWVLYKFRYSVWDEWEGGMVLLGSKDVVGVNTAVRTMWEALPEYDPYQMDD